MSSSGTRRAGWLMAAIVFFALTGLGSIWWVLDSPAVQDDQASRATFAGLLVGVVSLLVSAGLAVKGYREHRDEARTGAGVVAGDPAPTLGGPGSIVGSTVTQHVADNARAFVGGTHTHNHDRRPPQAQSASWDLLPSRHDSTYELRNVGDADAHDVEVTIGSSVVTPAARGTVVPLGSSRQFEVPAERAEGTAVTVRWRNKPHGDIRVWQKPLSR